MRQQLEDIKKRVEEELAKADVQQELERIAREKAKAEGHLKGIEAKLNSEAFTSKAPAHIVQNQRDQAEKLRALIAQLEQSAAAMGKMAQ